MWNSLCPEPYSPQAGNKNLKHSFYISVSLWEYKGIIEYNLLVKVTSRRRLLPFICNNVRSAESEVYLNLIYCPRHMSSPHIIVLWRLSGEERIDCILLGPRQLPQWSLFLKTIRWSWYSNGFRFGQLRSLIWKTHSGRRSKHCPHIDRQ